MRRRWLILPLLGIAGYFAVFGGEYSLLDVRRLERERTKEEAKVRATKRDVQALRARADSLEHDPITIERLAREKYGLIRPGERLYRFAGGAGAAPGDSPAVAGGMADDATAPAADSGMAGARGAKPAARDTSRRTSGPPAAAPVRPGGAAAGRKR